MLIAVPTISDALYGRNHGWGGRLHVGQELGVPQGESLGNHVAYLKSWLEALRNDRNCVFKAAKQASKVTDFLLGFVKKPEPVAAGATGREW